MVQPLNDRELFNTIARCPPVYPPLPGEYSLPPGCCCPNCAGELWEKMASNHPLKGVIIDAGGDVINRTFATRVDVSQLFDVLSTHLKRISSGNRTTVEQNSIYAFRRYVSGIQTLYKDNLHVSLPDRLPNIEYLGEIMSDLFFAGTVHKAKYEWKTPDQDPNMGERTYGYTNIRQDKICLNSFLYLGKGHWASTPPGQLIVDFIGTMVHELVHLYFRRYLCRGNCEWASEDEEGLCVHLSSRMVDMYDMLEHHGFRFGLPYTNLFKSHGPAFTAITRMLSELMTKLLGASRPISLQEVAPECGPNCNSSCWSHCYPDDRSQTKLIADEMAGHFADSNQSLSDRLREEGTEHWFSR